MNTLQLIFTALVSALIFIAATDMMQRLRKQLEEDSENEDTDLSVRLSLISFGCLGAIGLWVSAVGSGIMFGLCLMALFWH